MSIEDSIEVRKYCVYITNSEAVEILKSGGLIVLLGKYYRWDRSQGLASRSVYSDTHLPTTWFYTSGDGIGRIELYQGGIQTSREYFDAAFPSPVGVD